MLQLLELVKKMVSNNTEPELLLEYARDGLVDQEHYGFIVLADKKRAFDFTGDAKTIRSTCVLVQSHCRQVF